MTHLSFIDLKLIGFLNFLTPINSIILKTLSSSIRPPKGNNCGFNLPGFGDRWTESRRDCILFSAFSNPSSLLKKAGEAIFELLKLILNNMLGQGANSDPGGILFLFQLVLDYNDFMEIPFTRYLIKEINQHAKRLRTDVEGEVSQQDFHFPGLLPKVPGRFYYLFGKPIETRGLEDILKNRKNANGLYSEIKTEIESMMSYLQKKREGDPYRNIFRRILYQQSWNHRMGIPSFEP